MKVERVRNLSEKDFVEKFLLPKIPVIVIDEMEKWNLDHFTPDSLTKVFGEYDVQVYNDLFDLQEVETLQTYLSENFGKHKVDKGTSNYIRWYTKFKDIDFFWADEVFEKLAHEWSHPSFLPNSSLIVPYTQAGEVKNINHSQYPYKGLFISGEGARTRLHKDPLNSNAILCQFYGEKSFSLYSPDQLPYLTDGQGFVNPNQIDYDKFPLFDKAKCSFSDILRPGEIIYFPAGWFHDVSSLSDSVSITWNFIHNLEIDSFRSHISQYPNDQHEVVQYFLKKYVALDANAREICEHMKIL